jgi:C-methyltransferase C-terminal domain/Putative zinc binding domain/Methyltransferase domain
MVQASRKKHGGARRPKTLKTATHLAAAAQAGADSTRQTKCRICSSSRLRRYLHLGSTPLANAYLRPEQLAEPEFKEELALVLCEDCGLSQLSHVVAPDRMFRHYLYVSSTTTTFRDHCAELANSALLRVAERPSGLALDIGSNDGCLLRQFKAAGWEVQGVDPAKNLAAEANKTGIPTRCGYWSETAAQSIVKDRVQPSIITSTNVLAHTDDVHAFARAVKLALAPKGIWVIEAPYLLDFIRQNEFDTAYHEHLSYLAVAPLKHLLDSHELQVFDVDTFPELHGGTLRLWVCRSGNRPVHARVNALLAKERRFGLKRFSVYRSFAARVMDNKKNLRNMIHRLRKEGHTIWAYGASAKGNTLMNFFGLTRDDVPVVIDDNPKKWGYYAPGSHMRITGIHELQACQVDYLLLLAWNFAKEIKQRCRKAGYRESFILPVPKAKVV